MRLPTEEEFRAQIHHICDSTPLLEPGKPVVLLYLSAESAICRSVFQMWARVPGDKGKPMVKETLDELAVQAVYVDCDRDFLQMYMLGIRQLPTARAFDGDATQIGDAAGIIGPGSFCHFLKQTYR